MNSKQQMPYQGRLIPVQVPWQISSSTPFLSITLKETKPRQTEFVANFWSEQHDFHEKVVTLTFDARLVLVKSTLEADRGFGDADFNYDWSEIYAMPQPDEDISTWREKFNKQWRETGLCPDPNMYQVIDSQWLTSIYNTDNLYKHFLLIGEFMSLEFLCKSWSWEAGEIINWFK